MTAPGPPSSGKPVVYNVRFQNLATFEKEFCDNISKGGYYLKTTEPRPLRSRVEVRFHLPELSEPISLLGEVVHVVSADQPVAGMKPGMAVQFLDFNNQVVSNIDSVLTRLKCPPGPDMINPDVSAEEPAPEQPAPEEPAETAGEQAPEETPDETPEEPTEPGPEEDLDLDPSLLNESGEGDQELNLATGSDQSNLFALVRSKTLNQKIGLAKRGNRAVRNVLIQEGNKMVLRFILQNPKLTVTEVIAILKMPYINMEAIQTISKDSRWMQNDEVKYMIVLNPKSPLPVALNALNALNVKQLATIAKSRHTKSQIKSNALRLLEKRRSTGNI